MNRKHLRRVRAAQRFPKQPADDVKGKRSREEWRAEHARLHALIDSRGRRV